jgi:hypothetical protein
MFTERTIGPKICRQVEERLPRGTPSKAFFIPLALYVGDRHHVSRSLAMALFFWRPSAYTLVAVKPDILDICDPREVTELDTLVYHDSAWRSDGVEKALGDAFQHLRSIFPRTTHPLRSVAKFRKHSGYGVHSVAAVAFDKSDYTVPVTVQWKPVRSRSAKSP